jgi:hypothetical protein
MAALRSRKKKLAVERGRVWGRRFDCYCGRVGSGTAARLIGGRRVGEGAEWMRELAVIKQHFFFGWLNKGVL